MLSDVVVNWRRRFRGGLRWEGVGGGLEPTSMIVAGFAMRAGEGGGCSLGS